MGGINNKGTVGYSNQTELISSVISEITPDMDTFTDSYPESEIEEDKALAEQLKKNSNYVEQRAGAASLVLEKTFAERILTVGSDWFFDEYLYSNTDGHQPLRMFHTTEVDDASNHADFVITIKNAATKKNPVPFAIDLTYNIEEGRLYDKFRWRHAYGKDPRVSSGSEFGYIIGDSDGGGSDAMHSFKHRLIGRRGLKIPGFTSIKYYDELPTMSSPWIEPMIKKGRVAVLPRLIVGYQEDIIRYLEEDESTEEFKRANAIARQCTLLECSAQASDIYSMIDERYWARLLLGGTSASDRTAMTAEQYEKAKIAIEKMAYNDRARLKDTDVEEMRKARLQIKYLRDYFRKALGASQKRAREIIESASSPQERERAQSEYEDIVRSAENDIVCKAIIQQSNDTYINNNW